MFLGFWVESWCLFVLNLECHIYKHKFDQKFSIGASFECTFCVAWKNCQITESILWTLRFHVIFFLQIHIYLFGSISMPCPFTGYKMFCAGPNFLSQPKNFIAFSASSKTFASAQKRILLNANHIFVWLKMFVVGTIGKLIFGPTQKTWTCKRTNK